MSYRDPIIGALITLLNEQGPAGLKNRYSEGDPGVLPPKSQLPWCFLSYDPEGSVGAASNAEDESNIRLTINVVGNQTRDYGQAFDVRTGADVIDYMMGRNADYTFKSDSLIYVLRKYQVLGTNLWINLQDPIEIDGGVSFGKRGVDTYAREGIMRITITHHQLKPGVNG